MGNRLAISGFGAAGVVFARRGDMRLQIDAKAVRAPTPAPDPSLSVPVCSAPQCAADWGGKGA
ncbi:hypothetical protein GCM10023333_13390 [Ferrimonas pelagia]|uniref:Uncharacterized protein n=1 Tax=Ferrimonas pelagia TaxID=1177826 RepID=A0ABP9EKX7_9GAMM